MHIYIYIRIVHEYISSFLYIVFLVVSRIYKCDSSFVTIQYWKVMIAFTCIMYLYSVYIIHRDSDAFPRCNCWYRTRKGDPPTSFKVMSCHPLSDWHPGRGIIASHVFSCCFTPRSHVMKGTCFFVFLPTQPPLSSSFSENPASLVVCR